MSPALSAAGWWNLTVFSPIVPDPPVDISDGKSRDRKSLAERCLLIVSSGLLRGWSHVRIVVPA